MRISLSLYIFSSSNINLSGHTHFSAILVLRENRSFCIGSGWQAAIQAMFPASKSCKTLDGVHGLQVIPHSPFPLQDVSADGTTRPESEASSAVLYRPKMKQLRKQRPAWFRPVHSCNCPADLHLLETVANVVTSLPFIAIGLQAPRRNFKSRLYANSLVGLGIASTLYHSSRGTLKRYLRWADYTMIATTTLCLSRALRKESPKILMAASAFLLPIQPVMVTVLHTGMMEVAYARRASNDPDLRMTHNVHKLSSLIGGALFVADDFFPKTPFIHAAWHLAAAVGAGTCNKLLE